jgi:3-deoxy-D-manno-octulosonate 8-phosphate phosphatase (KDO 8-P phosphatase)
MISYKERLPKITTFIFDIDGVLTNGEIFFSQGVVMRALFAKDGYAIQYAIKKGYRMLVISGASAVDIKERLETLGMQRVALMSKDKLSVYRELQAEYGFTDEEVLYMGDDIPDIPLLEVVGTSACPQDACTDVKRMCHYQSPVGGGRGCVRDVIEQVMRVQGKWMNEDAYFW